MSQQFDFPADLSGGKKTAFIVDGFASFSVYIVTFSPNSAKRSLLFMDYCQTSQGSYSLGRVGRSRDGRRV